MFKPLKTMVFLLAFLVFGFFTSSAYGADWTTFRGNSERSGVSTETINVPMEKKWEYDIEGSDYSSPIVAGGNTFVGSSNGFIYSVSAAAGTLNWSYETGGAIESSPLFYNNIVYVGSTDGFLYALNPASGAVLWSFNAESAISSSPVTDGTNIYFAAQSGDIFSVSIATHNPVWGAPYNVPGGFSYPSAALVLSKQYNALFIGSEMGMIYAINTTGTTKWTYNTGENGFSASSPAVVGGVVYIGSNNGTVYGINANTGALSWSYNTPSGSDILGSPAVTSNTLYIGSIDGNFYAIGTSGGNRGSLLWSYNVGGEIDSSPVVSGDTVFVGADKLFFALNATTGDFKWSYGVGQRVTSPAISNGIVYIASDKLYALESTTTLVAMVEKWKYNTNSKITMSGVAVEEGITYIGADDGKLYAINANGTLRWQYSTGAKITTIPVVSSGTVYFGSENKTFYAVNTSDGTLKWSKLLGTASGYIVYSTPVISGNVIYFGAHDGKLWALNTLDGSNIWTPYQTAGQTSAGTYNLSTPVIDGGKIYFTYAGSAMVALDQNAGTKIWETSLGTGWSANIVTTSILLSNNTLFAGVNGKIYALNPDGTVKWATSISGSAERGFVSYGNILVGAGGSGNVYALDLNDGTILWEYAVKGPPGTPFLWQDVVFIMTSVYRVYALNVENGLLRFEYAGNFSPVAPVVTGGILYLGGRDGRIYAEDIDHYSMPMTSALGGTIMTVYGDTIQIPPGALSANTTITIAVAPNDQGGEGIVSLPRKYQFGPNGTAFSSPATVKFAYKTSDLQGADPNSVKVYVWDSIGSVWTASGGTADLANKTINVSLAHFSDYALFGGTPQLNFPVLSGNYVYAAPVTFKFSAFNPEEVTNVKGYLNGEEIQSGDQKKLVKLGQNIFRVVGQRSDGSEVSQEQRFEVSYSLEWLSPLTNQAGVGDNLPIKFKITDFADKFVEDQSVKVEVVDNEGHTTGVFSSEKGNVYIKISESHYLINLPIKNYSWITSGGKYQIKVSFDSQNYPPYEFAIQ